MSAKLIDFVTTPSVQTRHFKATLDLPTQQIHLWTARMGLAFPEAQTRRWRRYAPNTIFLLAVVQLLKTHTRLALNAQSHLIEFLKDDGEVLGPALDWWSAGACPLLVTDLNTGHEVLDADKFHGTSLIGRGLSWHVVSLSWPIDVLLDSTLAGGTDTQKETALKLRWQRELHTPQTEDTRTGAERPTPERHPPQAKGSRALDLDDTARAETTEPKRRTRSNRRRALDTDL